MPGDPLKLADDVVLLLAPFVPLLLDELRKRRQRVIPKESNETRTTVGRQRHFRSKQQTTK
jgi:hypothetical protein